MSTGVRRYGYRRIHALSVPESGGAEFGAQAFVACCGRRGVASTYIDEGALGNMALSIPSTVTCETSCLSWRSSIRGQSFALSWKSTGSDTTTTDHSSLRDVTPVEFAQRWQNQSRLASQRGDDD